MKKIYKMLFAIGLFATFTLNVNAQTITEKTDNYDENKFIIGSTRFDNNEVITADKVIAATKNQTKLDIALGIPVQEALAKKVPVYSYNKFFNE